LPEQNLGGGMINRLCLLTLLLSSALPVFAAVPITGRDQHMTFTRAQIQAAAASAYHQKIKLLSREGKLDTNPRMLHRVRKLCSRLIAQAIRLKPEASKWPWEVHITSDPEVAAYSMGGGKILVGTYFLSSYKLDNNELAVVLAHEIGHVIAEHVREQVSMAASFNSSLPPRSRKVIDVINAMQSDISIYFRLQPLSRLQEMEADDIGIELAARAGIPPSAVISFYTKLERDDDSSASVFNTHGAVAQRVKFADSMASYAKPVYEASRFAKPLPGYHFPTATR